MQQQQQMRTTFMVAEYPPAMTFRRRRLMPI